MRGQSENPLVEVMKVLEARAEANRREYPYLPEELLSESDCGEIWEAYQAYGGDGSLGAFLAGWKAYRHKRVNEAISRASVSGEGEGKA